MSHLDKIWLIADESILDELNTNINNELVNADLRTYPKDSKDFTFKRYHPTENLIASPFKVGKNKPWDIHILKHINANDLVKLGEDWKIEIDKI